MKKPNILMVSGWWPAGPIPFLAQALERMGCNVFRAGPEYNDHGGIDWGKYRVETDIPFYREGKVWDIDRVIDAAARLGFTPNLLILSEENYQTEIIPTAKIPTVYYSLDGWPSSFERGEALNPTLKYINHPFGNRPHPRTEETPGWKYLPGAADRRLHVNRGLRRDIDFTLHATPYSKRPELCSAVVDAGFSVLSGWVPTDKFIEGYNRGLMTYCNVNGNGHEIKWRFWESAACGCVNIIDHSILLERLGFLPYEHYVPIDVHEADNGELWPTRENLIETIVKIKANPSLLKHISTNAEKLTLERHTYENRCLTILNDLGFIVPNGFSEGTFGGPSLF